MMSTVVLADREVQLPFWIICGAVAALVLARTGENQNLGRRPTFEWLWPSWRLGACPLGPHAPR